MMSSVDMEMEDIFEEQDENDLDADIGIPDLDIEVPDVPQTQALTQTQDDSEVVAQLRGAAKKKTMKPQPKLDPLRLKGDRGLPILPKVFEKVKFKGKGHETEDLKLMMSKLEHWGHRLFPKLAFDDLISRMEKLGSKKEVQTCVKRIRLDMPILDEDFIGAGVEDVPEEDRDPQAQGGQVQNAEDLFDELLRQEQDVFGEAVNREQSPPASPTYNRNRVPSSPESAENSPACIITNTPKAAKTATTPATPGSVTETQKERMERNKRMALEKRAKRLGISVEELQQKMTPKSKSTEKTAAQTSPRKTSQDGSQPTNQNNDIDNIEPVDMERVISSQTNKKEGTTLSSKLDKEEQDNEGFVLAPPTKTPENDSEVPKLVLDLSEEDTDMKTAEEIMEILEDEPETCIIQEHSEKPKPDICDSTNMETDICDDSEITKQNTAKECYNTNATMDISEISDNEKENVDYDNLVSKSDCKEKQNNSDEDLNKQDLEENNVETLENESQSLSILS